MNFDTKYIEKIKGNYNYFRYIAEIHIYKKRRIWERWNLKNYQITLLLTSVHHTMKIVKIFNKDFDKECTNFFYKYNGTAALFIDTNNSYLYFNKVVYEIETRKFEYIRRQNITYPIYTKTLDYRIIDKNLNELINSYILGDEFI
jgi:hypothetical protein